MNRSLVFTPTLSILIVTFTSVKAIKVISDMKTRRQWFSTKTGEKVLSVLWEKETILGLQSCAVVYIAPMKSLCSERFEDWSKKFGALGVNCSQITGDTEDQDLQKALGASIVITTPEKWENVTRCLNVTFFAFIQLYLIDEIHMLSDAARGPTLEVLIARTKAANLLNKQNRTRFIAVSATCPNIDDVAAWLGSEDYPAKALSFDNSFRPVPLDLIVLGYPFSG